MTPRRRVPGREPSRRRHVVSSCCRPARGSGRQCPYPRAVGQLRGSDLPPAICSTPGTSRPVGLPGRPALPPDLPGRPPRPGETASRRWAAGGRRGSSPGSHAGLPVTHLGSRARVAGAPGGATSGPSPPGMWGPPCRWGQEVPLLRIWVPGGGHGGQGGDLPARTVPTAIPSASRLPAAAAVPGADGGRARACQ